MNIKTLLIVLSFITCNSYSQVIKTIDKLDAIHQKCLDNPEKNMSNCTIEYYNKLDSLLNVVYKKIRIKLSVAEQKDLKTKQLAWLKKRDLNFKLIEKETKELFEGDNSSEEYRMTCAHRESILVKKRIIELDKTYLSK